MRLKFLFLGLVGISVAFGQTQTKLAPSVQVWEKPIAPGLIYRMELDRETPLTIHALRWSLRSPAVAAVPELGGRTVFEDNETKGRATVSEMVKDTKAIAGINADFFPYTGDPLGTMVKDGVLMSSPNSKRVVFAWGPQSVQMGLATFSGLLTGGGSNIKIDAVNEECADNQLVLNTPDSGIAIGKKPCVAAVVKIARGKWAPSTLMTGTIEFLLPDETRTTVADGKAILVARGRKAEELAALKPGSKVTIRLQTTGFDWEKIDQAVGGGSMLVQNGKVDIDAEAEGFSAGFYDGRHPRTAIGETNDGDLWFVVVDGRQEISRGCTLSEMAKIMLRLGCKNAANLDGGGSSDMNLLGVVVNRPSDGKERPVANGVVFLPRVGMPEAPTVTTRLIAPGVVNADKPMVANVVGADRRTVPNIDVVWGSIGAAGWVDQGGTVHGLENGKFTLVAQVYGKRLTATIEVVGAKPKPKIAPENDRPGEKRTGKPDALRPANQKIPPPSH